MFTNLNGREKQLDFILSKLTHPSIDQTNLTLASPLGTRRKKVSDLSSRAVLLWANLLM